MKPRNKYDAFALVFDSLLVLIAVPLLIVGLWELALYMTLLAAIQTTHRWQVRRRYMDGWLEGRAGLLHTMITSTQIEGMDRDEQRTWFLEQMVEHDIGMMRCQMGERETQKFLDHAVKHMARSDGSHDAL